MSLDSAAPGRARRQHRRARVGVVACWRQVRGPLGPHATCRSSCSAATTLARRSAACAPAPTTTRRSRSTPRSWWRASAGCWPGSRRRAPCPRLRNGALEKAPEPRPVALGQVIAFYGAKGGVGTTTLPINAAIALQQAPAQGVVLVDANLQFGDHRVFLDLANDRRSIVDAVTAPAIDADLLRQIVFHHESGIDLLLAPARPEEAEHVSAERHHFATHHRDASTDVRLRGGGPRRAARRPQPRRHLGRGPAHRGHDRGPVVPQERAPGAARR